MKKPLLFVLSSIALFGLVGCNNQPAPAQTTTVDNTSEPAASSVVSTTSESSAQPTATSSEPKEEFITVDWDEEDYVSDNIKAMFDDISVGRPLLTDLEYIFSFSFSSGIPIANSRVELTDNGVASITPNKDDPTNFTVLGAKEGETIIKVYDGNDYLRYRNKMTFRKAMSETEVLRFAFEEVDHYESNFFKGGYITLIDTDTALYSGADEGTPLESAIRFTIEYVRSDETWHVYNVIEWDNKNAGSTLTLTEIHFDKSGYWIHAYTRNSVLDWFTPVF